MPARQIAAPTDYAKAATAANTQLAYRKDLARFIAWGGTIPAAPEQVADYLSAHGGSHKASTLARWVASISQAHLVAGFPKPVPLDRGSPYLERHQECPRRQTPARSAGGAR